jgi:hypothetical protein
MGYVIFYYNKILREISLLVYLEPLKKIIQTFNEDLIFYDAGLITSKKLL